MANSDIWTPEIFPNRTRPSAVFANVWRLGFAKRRLRLRTKRATGCGLPPETEDGIFRTPLYQNILT